MRKKGLGLEEKRQRLLDVYYEKKEVLNLKEVEKFGAKRGIVLQSIKDVNQSLIDDNLVETDKIGNGSYFWALPSKGFQVRKNLILDYDSKIEKTKRDIEETSSLIEKAIQERDNTNGKRGKMQEELEKAQKLKAQLDIEVKNYERSDPKTLHRMEVDSKIAKDATNRWTDNLFLISQWITNSRPNITMKDLEKSFPVYKELDHIA